jgi:hypothetical protein
MQVGTELGQAFLVGLGGAGALWVARRLMAPDWGEEIARIVAVIVLGFLATGWKKEAALVIPAALFVAVVLETARRIAVTWGDSVVLKMHKR